MGRYASDTGGGEFAQAPTGNHLAICIRIIDLGTQIEEYQGQRKKQQKLLVQWELPEELMEPNENGERRPFIVSKWYTNSIGEKANLRKDLISWRGVDFTPEELKRFDLQTILGKPCMVNVVHTDKGKAKITSVAKMPKGMKAPAPVNEVWSFWLDEFDPERFSKISEGIRKIIVESPEYLELQSPRSQPATVMAGADDDMDDDIPF